MRTNRPTHWSMCILTRRRTPQTDPPTGACVFSPGGAHHKRTHPQEHVYSHPAGRPRALRPPQPGSGGGPGSWRPSAQSCPSACLRFQGF
eukprot:1180449-Prorocentrum_minimum.AAC.2